MFSQPIKSNIYRVVLTRTHFFLKITLKKFEDWTWMCPQRQTVFLNVLVTVSFWAVCSFNVGLSSGLFVFWSYSSQKSVREEPTGVKNIFCHLNCRNRPFEWSVKQPITSPVSNKVRLKSSNRRSKNIIVSTPGGWQCVTDGQATQMCDFYSALMSEFHVWLLQESNFRNEDCIVRIRGKLSQQNWKVFLVFKTNCWVVL